MYVLPKFVHGGPDSQSDCIRTMKLELHEVVGEALIHSWFPVAEKAM